MPFAYHGATGRGGLRVPLTFRAPLVRLIFVRLGLLGPAEGKLGELGRSAEFLLNVAKVDRAIYLGNDEALEKTVVAWAMRLVGHDPTDDGAWRTAAHLVETGSPQEIDGFVRAQRARLRLRALESLPSAASRTIEMIGDRVAILIYDKALLDEEDIFAANLLIYGKSDGPLVRRIGARWFITPGPLGSKEGGIAVLDDEEEDVVVTIHGGDGTPSITEILTFTRATKVHVQGGA